MGMGMDSPRGSDNGEEEEEEEWGHRGGGGEGGGGGGRMVSGMVDSGWDGAWDHKSPY